MICPSQPRPEADPRLCYSRSAGVEIIPRTSKAGQPIRVVQSQKHITEAVKSALTEWRATKAATVLCLTVFTDPKAQLILLDKAIFHISRTGAAINSVDALAIAVNSSSKQAYIERGFEALYR